MTSKLSRVFVLFLALGIFASVNMAQTTGFVYQGSLNSSGVVANGNHDFEFALFDAASGGAQLGATITQSGVGVTNGIFAVSLDFGNQFPGASRFLEIRVRQTGGGGFTTLTPRQPVASTPYAIKSTTSDAATTATNATQLGGVAASQFVQTADPRLTDARPPTAGSSNYIQNTTSLQSLSNFNVSGTGTANVFNSTSDYHVSGFRVLSTLGTNNVFVGIGSGLVNTGARNAFFGRDAGQQNTSGERNSFLGYAAGQGNITGGNNSFFGTDSGASNNSGSNNSFFGSQAGRFNAGGINNSFFGNIAGRANLTGVRNSFFGAASGAVNSIGEDNTFVGFNSGTSNTSGFFNTFFGSTAGQQNSTGGNNSFFGRGAGLSNTTGSNNTVIGDSSNVSAGNLSFATAIGAQAVVGTSNTMVLGRPADTVQVPGTLSVTGTLSANVFNATTQYNVGGNRVLSVAGTDNVFVGVGTGSANTTGNRNAFFGQNAGQFNTTGILNSFFGKDAGRDNTTGNENSFFGDGAGRSNTTGGLNTLIGDNADVGAGNLSYATAIGANSVVSTSNTIVLGRATGSELVRIPGRLDAQANVFVGYNTLPLSSGENNLYVANDGGDADNVFRLDGSNNNLFIIARSNAGAAVGAGLVFRTGFTGGGESTRMTINPAGTVEINILGAGGATSLCRNSSLEISTCSSSLRYKTNINRFGLGLNLINQLKPITFDWKNGGMHDLGLGAEDVAAIEPLLVTYNTKGEVEGVKYDRIGVVLVNAVKEQQTEIGELRAVSSEQARKIEDQNSKIKAQQKQIDALTRLVCASNKDADICKEQ